MNFMHLKMVILPKWNLMESNVGGLVSLSL